MSKRIAILREFLASLALLSGACLSAESTELHVRDFGAIPNDQLSDTVAIQKAIEAAIEQKAARLISSRERIVCWKSYL